MIKPMKCIVAVALSLCFYTAYGQIAEELLIPVDFRRSACIGGNMVAGDISIRPLGTQSINTSGSPYILCYGDQLFIDHAGNFDFSADPEPMTTPGIGYAFYSCEPTVIGETIDMITAFDCPIIDPLPPNMGLWVARGEASGDVTFSNLGQVQEQFFDGDAGTVWFAPITVTDFDSLSFDDGSCVNVSVDQAFEVTYLNQITLDNFTTDDPMSLTGSFGVSGGLSEIDFSNYTITMVKSDNPGVTGTIDAAVQHGGSTTFSVPEPGLYTVTITDGTGCSQEFIVSVPTSTPVNLCLGTTAQPYGSNFCMPVTVSNFMDVVSIAFTISWDPNVIEFNGIMDQNPILAGASFDMSRADEGQIPLLWFDNLLNLNSLPDGDTLFSLCFNVNANATPGDNSPLRFTNDLTPISITDDVNELPVDLKQGSVTIIPSGNVRATIEACGDGSVINFDLTAFGGTEPYTYDVMDGSGATVQSGMIDSSFVPISISIDPDNYQILVTDATGAFDLLNVVFDANPITIDTASFNPSCMGVADGRIVVNDINGGVAPYSMTWRGPGFTRYGVDSITNLLDGMYQLEVRDANGCSTMLDFELVVDSLEVNYALVAPLCSGMTGDITPILPGGGGSTYEWRWTDESGANVRSPVTSATPVSINDVEPGTYYLSLTNMMGGCTFLDTVPLFPLKRMSFVMDSFSNVRCTGEDNGYIGLEVSVDRNMALPYDFSWSPNTYSHMVLTMDDTVTTASELPPGTYDLTVTDDSGCTIDTSFTIEEPDTLVAMPFVLTPTCPDGSDGVIDGFLGNHGGTRYPTGLEYRFEWFNGSTNTSVTNLPAGDYGLTVTDFNGCQDSTVITLRSGPAIEIVQDMQLDCPGDSIASLMVIGELAGNTIEWSTGSMDETITNLSAGLYQVTVTEVMDTSTCAVVDTFTVMDPDLGVRVIRPMQFVPRSRCNEPDSGILFNLQLAYSGPQDVIWHTLNDSITSNPFIVIDSSADYFFTVFDPVTGCALYDSVITAQFPEQIMVEVDTTNVSCNGDTDGSIEVLATGRGGLFDFDWSNGLSSPVPVASSRLDNLAPGTYSLTLTEAADSTCMVDFDFEVREPDVLTLSVDSATTQDVRCFGEGNGQISIIWEGGNRDMAPTVNWSAGGLTGSLTATGLGPGTYDVELIDSRGCTDMISVTLTEPGELFADIPMPTEPVCNGQQTSITVNSASGGTGNSYTFSVDNGPSQMIGAALPAFAGSHLVSVFDEMGCRLDTMFVISEPAAIAVSLGDDVSVDLGDSVQITADLTSTAAPDTYIWTPQGALSCMDCADPFVRAIDDIVIDVVVIDADGCEAMDQVLVRVDKSRNVYIPNGFTPNGDGVNDIWRIYTGAGVLAINGIQLFDRWGNLVYASDSESLGPGAAGSSPGWDGRFGADMMNPGVYTYLAEIEFIDGRVLTYRGDVTLVP